MPSKGNVAEVQVLGDDLELTQYGEEGEAFRNELRVERGETEMSLILGRQTPMAAALLVTKTAAPWAHARYTTVGKLRRAAFEVRHSPTKGNALHVSVFPPTDPQGPREWDGAMASAFDQCFTSDGEDQ
ncbi:hypothetical protein J2S43_007281 [Catenuloplanes nepalensis]|uniref:Uncharacterized protein n=1 Tax=Catenuloplanes nepalensis TaxID=587533 RepID=A0ABT9N503_9ACTN|nr:hypothetical protein [Catenuloplanes nepalensis]MDP9798769.1 hypothetical protein [Catenuloplanes nepalensis]